MNLVPREMVERISNVFAHAAGMVSMSDNASNQAFDVSKRLVTDAVDCC